MRSTFLTVKASLFHHDYCKLYSCIKQEYWADTEPKHNGAKDLDKEFKLYRISSPRIYVHRIELS